jgi:asparagine synthase (glutamine-hydrolysing)
MGVVRANEALRLRRGASRFHGSVLFQIKALQRSLDRGVIGEQLDCRFPFLDRRLVEFALRLPIDQKVRPDNQKWILRQATQGILPEKIRTRTGKGGGLDGRYLWSLEHEASRIRELLAHPILADLGCIEPAILRSAIEEAARGRNQEVAGIVNTMSLETWLHVQAGRWVVREPATRMSAGAGGGAYVH